MWIRYSTVKDVITTSSTTSCHNSCVQTFAVQPGQNTSQFHYHNCRSIYNGLQELDSSQFDTTLQQRAAWDQKRTSGCHVRPQVQDKTIFGRVGSQITEHSNQRTTYRKTIIRLVTFYSPYGIPIGYFDLRVTVSRNRC
jgi:hypothetical protein